MNVLDVLFLGVLLLSLAVGLCRGLVREILGGLGLAGGFLAALALAPPLSLRIPFVQGPFAYATAFLAIFFAVLLAAELFGKLITRALESAKLTWPNRLAGGLFGLVRGAVLAVVLFLALLFFLDNPERLVRGSRLAPWAHRGARALCLILPGKEKARWGDRLNSPGTAI
jgi:membrane protein required for colicin V production